MSLFSVPTYRDTRIAAGAIIFAFLYSAVAATQVERSSSLLVGQNGSTVWRVYANGDLKTLLSLKDDAAVRKGWFSEGTALPSRDERFVAFTRNNDVWILDIESGKKTRITRVGMPMTKTFTFVRAYPKLWSWDGRRLLYEVSPGDTEDPEGEKPQWKVRKALYGHFVYDFDTHSSIEVEAPQGYLLSWLPDGRAISWMNHGWTLVGIATKKLSGAAQLKGAAMQIGVYPDGAKFVTAMQTGFSSSQIVEVELSGDSWKVDPITPLGTFTEYQWPKFSASGSRYSYVHQTNSGVRAGGGPRTPESDLVVGEKSIYSFSGYVRYTWIGDKALAVSTVDLRNQSTRLVVLDADTGRSIASHDIDHGNSRTNRQGVR